MFGSVEGLKGAWDRFRGGVGGADSAAWDMDKSVMRKWGGGALEAEANPLTPFAHDYRFAKMHAKLPPWTTAEYEPYLFPAAGGQAALGKGEVTACMYTNDYWSSEIVDFVKRWGGPVSLVWETDASRVEGSKARVEVLNRIEKLRDSDPSFKALVDVHLVSLPAAKSATYAQVRRERMLEEPVAMNAQLNLARFFSRTSIVWLVGDARVFPSHNLRVKLNGETLRRQVLQRGDALVVPTFGFLRSAGAVPSLAELKATTGGWGEVTKAWLTKHKDSVPVAKDAWPKTKRSLVGLTAKSSAGVAPQMAMFDDSWEAARGPTNWALWRKPATDPRLEESPDAGGGAGIGLGGKVGGGNQLYRVTAYDLHYAPNVVVSKEGQPWCTERFEVNKAACAYQFYLTGAEMWVVPDEWGFTTKVMEKMEKKEDDATKLKASISARLYTKYHQEACMHYGREFLSIGAWETDRAKHLRMMCSRVNQSWGIA